MTVLVGDPAKLMAAALASVEKADFTDTGEKEMFRKLVTSEPAEALQWLADTDEAFYEHGASAEEATVHARQLSGSLRRTPDFGVLFTACPCETTPSADGDDEYCDLCGGWSLTANTANCLYGSFDVLIDHFIEDLNEHGDEPVSDAFHWMAFDLLPNFTWGVNKEWRVRFVRSCVDLQDELAEGCEPRPRCTAEEMALHLAIDHAPMVEEFDRNAYEPRRDDFDWQRCSDRFFEDHDILMAEESPWLLDPEDTTNKMMRIGDLRANNWFNWFASCEARDAKRFLKETHRLPGLGLR